MNSQYTSKSMKNQSHDTFSNSNVTLWKSKFPQEKDNTQKEKVENNYIENLRKQVYFMEMELKLMKEREREIEKSGGFSKLYI